MDLEAQLRLAKRETWLRQAAALRRVWRGLPLPGPLRELLRDAVIRRSPKARAALELGAAAHGLAAARPLPVSTLAPGPLVLSGFLSEPSGVGRGARMSLAALRAGGHDPQPHDLARQPAGWGEETAGGVWFAHCNAPEALGFLLRSRGPARAYRIGYWAWELPQAPPAWGEVAGLFHEIWAPSAYVASAVRAVAPRDVAVRTVPHPCPDLTLVADRRSLGWSEAAFVFLSLFDVRSSAARKNPLGAVRAFQRAFGPADGRARLVVKVSAADADSRPLRELQAAASGWPNIQILTATLSDAAQSALIASADVLVSLHRAEGFGLPIAEAMAAGRPVIVTDWSGNVDFCTAGARRIPFALTPVHDPGGIYSAPELVWADPDLDAAARAMSELAADPAAARALGAAGRRHVAASLPTAYVLEGPAKTLVARR